MSKPPQPSRGTPFWIAAAVLGWLGAVLLAGGTGWLGSLSPLAPPPIAALTMIVPVAVYFAVPAFRDYVARLGLRRLTSIHVLRITAAPLFFWYGAHRLLPQLFVDRAAWGDIAAGILALLAVTFWQRPSGYWLAHLFGMADFFVAFGTAIALTRQDPAAVHAVTGLPMAVIPFFGVGLLATTHVMAYHLLVRQKVSRTLTSTILSPQGVQMTQPNPPQQLPQVPCIGVLVQLTIKPGIHPQKFMGHMPAEVRDTVLLYLEGHISQWWALCDRPGVLFLFTATSVDAVQQLMSALPLVQEDLVDLTFTRVGPLTPLRILLNVVAPSSEV